MTREEILSKLEANQQPYYTFEEILAAMSEFAQQEAIAFAEWKDKNYIQHHNGYYSIWNDGSHGKSHIMPKFRSLTDLYKTFKTTQNG